MDYIPVKRERKLIFIQKETNKLSKKDNKKNRTIEEIHDDKMKYFNELQTTVLQQKEKSLKEEKCQTKYFKLRSEIFDIKNRMEESFYFCKIGHVLTDYFSQKDAKKKEILTKEYYYLLNIPYKEDNLCLNNYDCEKCGGELSQEEESMVCLKCGIAKGINIAYAPTFKEINEGSYVISKKVIYKRESYFLELLKNIQTVKTSDFPENMLENIKKYLYVNNITHTKEINPVLIRSILKKLNYSKYYDQIQSIICVINQEKPLSIPKPVEGILKHMFQMIQDPWEKCKSSERHSFFSYPYVLYKFFQILDLDEYLPYLTLLKSREKLIKHELLWEQIVDYIVENDLDRNFYFEINWRYIPLI